MRFSNKSLRRPQFLHIRWKMHFENSRSFHSIVTLITVHKKTLWWPWCFLSQPNAEHISPPRSNYSVPLNGIATGYNQPFSFKFIYFSTLCMVFFPSLHCIFHPFLYCFASCDKGFRKTLNRKAASVAVSSLFWPSSTFSSTSSPLQCFQHFAETPPQYHQHFAQPPPQYH